MVGLQLVFPLIANVELQDKFFSLCGISNLIVWSSFVIQCYFLTFLLVSYIFEKLCFKTNVHIPFQKCVPSDQASYTCFVLSSLFILIRWPYHLKFLLSISFTTIKHNFKYFNFFNVFIIIWPCLLTMKQKV